MSHETRTFCARDSPHLASIATKLTEYLRKLTVIATCILYAWLMILLLP